jgi:hypothetical protein
MQALCRPLAQKCSKYRMISPCLFIERRFA